MLREPPDAPDWLESAPKRKKRLEPASKTPARFWVVAKHIEEEVAHDEQREYYDLLKKALDVMIKVTKGCSPLERWQAAAIIVSEGVVRCCLVAGSDGRTKRSVERSLDNALTSALDAQHTITSTASRSDVEARIALLRATLHPVSLAVVAQMLGEGSVVHSVYGTLHQGRYATFCEFMASGLSSSGLMLTNESANAYAGRCATGMLLGWDGLAPPPQSSGPSTSSGHTLLLTVEPPPVEPPPDEPPPVEPPPDEPPPDEPPNATTLDAKLAHLLMFDDNMSKETAGTRAREIVKLIATLQREIALNSHIR